FSLGFLLCRAAGSHKIHRKKCFGFIPKRTRNCVLSTGVPPCNATLSENLTRCCFNTDSVAAKLDKYAASCVKGGRDYGLRKYEGFIFNFLPGSWRFVERNFAN